MRNYFLSKFPFCIIFFSKSGTDFSIEVRDVLIPCVRIRTKYGLSKTFVAVQVSNLRTHAESLTISLK